MVEWTDVSQYNPGTLDERYPHRIFCFRTNSGNSRDTVAIQRAKEALALLNSGKLDVVIAYYFFWPGQANCDLHKKMLEEAGLWGHPRLVTMVDVEDAGGRIVGNHSVEVNDEVQRIQGWYGDKRRVIGYLNSVANPGLWAQRPDGLRFVTPSYSFRPGVWATPNPAAWMQAIQFAQQYTDRGTVPGFTGGVDLNYSAMSVADIMAMLGIESEGTLDMSDRDVVEQGAAQLRNGYGNVRRFKGDGMYLPKSFHDEAGPWPNDVWAAICNEVAWDGFTIDEADADVADNKERSLVGLVKTIAARQVRIEGKLDRLLDQQSTNNEGDK